MNRPPSSQNPNMKFQIYSQIILKDIAEIEQYAKDNNLLDTQEYLDFQDTLNKWSIDPDRTDK